MISNFGEAASESPLVKASTNDKEALLVTRLTLTLYERTLLAGVKPIKAGSYSRHGTRGCEVA